MIALEDNGRQIKQVDSWEQIKFRLNENLLKKRNARSECHADLKLYEVKRFNGTNVQHDNSVI